MHRIGKFQTSKLIAAVAVVVMMPVLILASTVAKAALTATVDRTSVTELDLVTLTIRLSHATATGSPDFGVLEKDFDLVRLSGPNRSSQIIIENGRQFTDSHVEWALSLRPKRTGELTIPSFTVAGERTDPISINVQEANARTVNRMNQFVFFETSVDTTSTYVQGQVIYTVKLFYVDAISGDFPPPPTISDAVIETIENEKRYESIIDNRRFYVLEKRYAIYPQRSGELIIPRETFTGTRGRGGFFSDRERVSAVSKQHLIEIKPRPDRFPSSHWLPAQAVTVTESWSQTGAGERGPTFTVGEPVNRTLTVTAIGLSSSLLPPFAPLELDNAKTYQDPAETNDRRSPDGMIASLKTTVGIVPTKAGTLTVPEVRIPWWNTTTDRLEIATIPSQTFEVAPAPASSSTFVPPETPTVTGPAQQTPAPMVEGSESRIWQTIAAILAAIWAITLYQWWALRRRLDQALTLSTRKARKDRAERQATTTLDEKAAFERLEKACRANDPAEARRALTLWTKARYPQIRSLTDLTTLIGDDKLSLEVNKLEAILFAAPNTDQASAADWRGSGLLTRVEAVRNERTADEDSGALLHRLNPV